jgi:hypothetical protein
MGVGQMRAQSGLLLAELQGSTSTSTLPIVPVSTAR